MASYYVPSAAGYADDRGLGYFRFLVDQVYDAANNKSTLTIRMQFRGTGSTYGGTYSLYSGTISVNGTVKQTFNNTGYTVKVDNGSGAAWYTVQTNGGDAIWTETVNHGVSGAASVALAIGGSFRLYAYIGTTGRYIAFDGASWTLNLSNYPMYTLSISAGDGSQIIVNRTSSPAGAVTGALANGAAIYYGDVLTVGFSASVGYTLGTHTVNGSTFTSGGSLTVSRAVSVVSTATRNAYTLTITADANTTLTVKRNGATLSSGATIYYGDSLTATAAPKAGYQLASFTRNGAAVASPNSVSVTGNVSYAASSTPLGFCYVRRSSAWAAHLIYLWHSGAWQRYRAFVWRNGAWQAY